MLIDKSPIITFISYIDMTILLSIYILSIYSIAAVALIAYILYTKNSTIVEKSPAVDNRREVCEAREWFILTNDFEFLLTRDDYIGYKQIIKLARYSSNYNFSKFVLAEHKKKLINIATKISYDYGFRQLYNPNAKMWEISQELKDIINRLTVEDLQQIFTDLNNFYYPNHEYRNPHYRILQSIRTEPLRYLIAYGAVK